MDKKKLSIVLAVVLAAVAVVMVRNYINQTEKKFVREEKMAYVLVATQKVSAGETLDESMLKLVQIPEQYLQPRAIASQSMAVGRRAIADILPGEQILMTKLTIAVKDTTMAMRTPQGKRAFTFTIDPLAAVGGKIRPGDYVDVLGMIPYTSQVDGKLAVELVSVTLFQNVMVLSVEGESAAPAERGKAPAPASSNLIITLALSPKEAALMSYAVDKGKIRLVLRPPLETATEPVPPVEANLMWQYVFSSLGQEFLNPKEEARPAPAKPAAAQKKEEPKKQEAPPPATVDFYRGTEKTKLILR